VTTYVVVNAQGDAIAGGLTGEEAGLLLLTLRGVAYSITPWDKGWLLRVNDIPTTSVYGFTPSEARTVLLASVARKARIADGWPAEAETIRDRAPAP
jgi:hypothetical protein